jgi:hypothetical protein
MPKHLKCLGKCDRCGEAVLSPRDRKDHTIGEAQNLTLLLGRYKSGMKLNAAWTQMWCSPCIA